MHVDSLKEQNTKPFEGCSEQKNPLVFVLDENWDAASAVLCWGGRVGGMGAGGLAGRSRLTAAALPLPAQDRGGPAGL